MLQWGQRLSALDTYRAVGFHENVSAMLQWGQRLSALDTRSRLPGAVPRLRRFNGANAFQRWIHEEAKKFVSENPGLQWGQRLSALDTEGGVRGGVPRPELQWGQRLSALDTIVMAYQFTEG